jgi:hypothetical protein
MEVCNFLRGCLPGAGAQLQCTPETNLGLWIDTAWRVKKERALAARSPGWRLVRINAARWRCCAALASLSRSASSQASRHPNPVTSRLAGNLASLPVTRRREGISTVMPIIKRASATFVR